MAVVTDSGPLTTHVLNTADGIPATRMALSLHRLDSKLMIWNLLSVGYFFFYSSFPLPFLQTNDK